MKEDVRALIDAITNNDAVGTEEALNTVMGAKVAARLDDFRVEIASTMFNRETTDNE